MKEQIKAIILDMYGVILKQTGDDFAPFVQQTFPDLTVDDIYKVWLRADIGEIPSLEVWKELGYTGDLKAVEEAYLDTLDVNDGFYDFVEKTGKNYKLAILSNDPSEWSSYIRDKYEMNQYFDVIHISGDLKMKKPDERIYQLTMKKLGCQPAECIYVDDRPRNLLAAQKTGMHVVHFGDTNIDFEGQHVDNLKKLSDLCTQERVWK